MAGTAFLGGLAEALFLITVTRVALAIAKGNGRVGMVSGWFLSLNEALLFCFAVLMLRLLLAIYANAQASAITTRVVAAVRHRLAGAFLDASWAVQQEQRAGSLQELLMGYSNQAGGLMTSLGAGVLSAANLAALLAGAVGVNPLGALVLVVSVGVLALLLRPLRSAVRRRARIVTASTLEFATAMNEVSQLGLELHVFHVQEQARSSTHALIEALKRKTYRLAVVTGLATPVYTGLAYLALLGALAVVAESHTTSVASLGASMLVMLRSLSYGQALQGAYIGVSSAVPAIEELQRRLGMFQAARRVGGGDPVGHLGPIGVDGVSFAYIKGQGVLRDVSFTIAPHEIVGIVGPSGGGKSTLVQLLLGLRDPDHGRVLAGGRDIATLDRGEWARAVTFVPQAAHLIAGTIADNIRFLREGVTPEHIENAARLAFLHDEIMQFPEAYDHQVGEHGGHLSGGQQQRLCIARALVEQPEMLILDEPTSALDVRSEHLIRTTLLQLKERMTVVVIAHRLSTVTMCDRIMVIQNGRLQAFDTPAALERSSPFYREALTLSGMR